MTAEIVAGFPDVRRAESARARLIEDGLSADAISVQLLPNITAREGGFMSRVVLIIVLWSIAGGALGVAIGVTIALTIGPSGTAGLVIQGVTWGICFHLLVGIWAGYLLLADRTRRDVLPPPARLIVHVSGVAADDVSRVLRDLGATDVDVHGGRRL